MFYVLENHNNDVEKQSKWENITVRKSFLKKLIESSSNRFKFQKLQIQPYLMSTLK